VFVQQSAANLVLAVALLPVALEDRLDKCVDPRMMRGIVLSVFLQQDEDGAMSTEGEMVDWGLSVQPCRPAVFLRIGIMNDHAHDVLRLEVRRRPEGLTRGEMM
jgi:hypothetical protein